MPPPRCSRAHLSWPLPVPPRRFLRAILARALRRRAGPRRIEVFSSGVVVTSTLVPLWVTAGDGHGPPQPGLPNAHPPTWLI